MERAIASLDKKSHEELRISTKESKGKRWIDLRVYASGLPAEEKWPTGKGIRIPAEEWEQRIIDFQPSVSLVRSEWPIFDLWKGCKRKESLKAVMAPRGQRILIGRKEFQVRCELVDENQFRLLEALLARRTLGEACAALAENLEGDSLPVAEWFSRWAQDGLIARCGPSAPSRTGCAKARCSTLSVVKSKFAAAVPRKRLKGEPRRMA